MEYYKKDELFASPRELIDYFLQDQWFRTKSQRDANLAGKAGMIFRGQSDSSWSLLPKAFRLEELNNFTPQPPLDSQHLLGLNRVLGYQMHAEARAIDLFLQNADGVGFSTPIDYAATRHALKLVQDTFDRISTNPAGSFPSEALPYPPESLHRATALAQHHGVPTRFLDWSESPLVACYFAAYGASTFVTEKPKEDQEISITYMESAPLNEQGSPVQLIKAPRYENSHLLQQKGIFTSISRVNEFYIKHRRWPTLEDFSSDLQMSRVRLKASQADDLLRELFDLDITRLSLMPTLDNAAKSFSYIKILFKSLT
jgi:hypothetical protein